MMRNRLILILMAAVILAGFVKDDGGASSFSGAANFAAGTAPASISDDFSGDLSAWTQNQGSWGISTGELNIPDNSKGQIVYNTQTPTITQYAAMKMTIDDGSLFDGLVLRSENDCTAYNYVVRYTTTATQFEWRSCAGANHSNVCGDCTEIAVTASHVFTSGDYFGASIAGTGDATVVKVYVFGSTGVPDIGDWDSTNEWNATLTTNPTYLADVGKHVGVYTGNATVGGKADDFEAWSY